MPGEVKDNIEHVDKEESDQESKIDSVEVHLQSFNRIPVPLAHYSHGLQIHFVSQIQSQSGESGFVVNAKLSSGDPNPLGMLLRLITALNSISGSSLPKTK